MAQQRPELFTAYVGTGQVTAWAELVQFQFDFLKQRYKEQGNDAALAELEAIGSPDPKNVEQYFRFSRPIRQNLNPSDTAWFAGMLGAFKADGGTDASLKVITDSMTALGPALIGASVAADLPATATRFALPYYVIQGRYDLFSPTPLAEAYFEKVAAPRKRLIVIEDAGHFALSTHQAEMAAALTGVVADLR